MCHARCHMLDGSAPQSAAWADLSSRWDDERQPKKKNQVRSSPTLKKPTCVDAAPSLPDVLWHNIKEASSDLLDLQARIRRKDLDLPSYFPPSLTSLHAMMVRFSSSCEIFESEDLIINIFQLHHISQWTSHNIHLLSAPNLDLYHSMCLKKKTNGISRISESYWKIYSRERCFGNFLGEC